MSKMLLGTGRNLTFGYYNLLRPQSETLDGIYQRRRNYTNAGTTNRDTNRINYFNYFTADGVTMKLSYQYKYDAAGNIKEVYSRTGSNTLALESSYVYDKLDQLTKVTGKNGTETYNYDTAGNLLSRTLGSTTSAYTYGNSSWGDLHTAFKGKGIAYEGQTCNSSANTVSGTVKSGNPVSYYNGTRWSMDWANGRQLTSAIAGSKNISYTYDKNGLRSSKTVNGITYEYSYAADKLVWQGWSGNEMYFFYDNNGAPVAFWYFPSNGGARITGHYMANQQGDIVRIEDQNGVVIANYAYDAWGKLISSSGSMGTINPLRYRGYYYDTDTSFYYLQSRYYDPVASRFINAYGLATTGQDVLGYNMFAYCQNNPLNLTDSTGGYPIESGQNSANIEKDYSAVNNAIYRYPTISQPSVWNKIDQSIAVFIKSMSLNAGMGYGLSFSIPMTDNLLEFGVKRDFFAIDASCDKGLRIGNQEDVSVVLVLPESNFGQILSGILGIDISTHKFTSYANIGGCPKHQFCTCTIVDESTTPSQILGISASSYVVFGGAFSVGWDMTYVFQELGKIWGWE